MEQHTFVAPPGLSFEYIRMRLMQTITPLRVPLYTSPGPPEVIG